MNNTEDSSDEEQHPLMKSLLNERLPTLGLDAETYGPYIVALFPLSDNAVPATTKSTDELEGWDEILELLQASSELEEPDDVNHDAWIQLKDDLISTWQSYCQQQQEIQQLKRNERERQLQAMLQIERDLAMQNITATPTSNEGAIGNNNTTSLDEATKRALLNRFGYEDNTNDIGDDDKERGGTMDASTAKANHAITTTKREEQQKTKAAQQQKVDAKEERRKRAVKGERRR